MQDPGGLGHHPHEPSHDRAAFGDYRAQGNKLSGAVGNAELRTVNDVAIAPGRRSRIARRYQASRIDVAAQKSCYRLRAAAGLYRLDILAGIHAESLERLDGEIMGVAAESPDADLFSS